MTETRLKTVVTSFVLAVADVPRKRDCRVDVMGFEMEIVPDGWRYIRGDGRRIMLGECPDSIPPAQLGDYQYFAYLLLDDVDANHRESASRGADIIMPPTDKARGPREMSVRTPDGHHICFGTEIV